MRPPDASASLHSMALALKGARDVRIMTQHPITPWYKVWGNPHAVWSSQELRAAWLIVIHYLIPTNDQLAKIQWSITSNCQHCGRVDTLIHRLNECCERADIWRWTRSRIAIILRKDPKYILPEWAVRPSFHFWPPQRHRAILWILAHMIYITIHNTGTENRPSTTLISWGVPDGKHIKQLTGAKRFGITWGYYTRNLRHTSPEENVFPLAAG